MNQRREVVADALKDADRCHLKIDLWGFSLNLALDVANYLGHIPLRRAIPPFPLLKLSPVLSSLNLSSLILVFWTLQDVL